MLFGETGFHEKKQKQSIKKQKNKKKENVVESMGEILLWRVFTSGA